MLHEGLEILIDTGSPVTLSNLNQFELMGKTHQCSNQMVGCTFDSIKELLGREIDILLGMDVLRNYRLLVDCQVGHLVLSDESLTIDDATSVALHPSMMNTAVAIEAKVADRSVQLVVDTGAKISYISKKLCEGMESVEEREDFHPYIGTFKTPIYRMTIDINQKQLSTDFGNLPQLYAMTLSMANLDGVIGYDLFAANQVVLDFPSMVMLIGS